MSVGDGKAPTDKQRSCLRSRASSECELRVFALLMRKKCKVEITESNCFLDRIVVQ